MTGAPFIAALIYLTFIVSFTVSLLETGFGPEIWRPLLRRWGNFLLALGILVILVEALTLVQGWIG